MTTSHLDADVAVIGFGKGGKTLAANLGREGRRVVMIEQSAQMYGGTCINVGCVPTKALLQQAHERPGGEFTVAGERWFGHAMGAVHTLTGALRAKNFAMLDTLDAVTVVTGRAHFTGLHTLEVEAGADRLTVNAATIILNTGARPVVPPELAGSANVLTNASLLQADALPCRLAIVGGGYLGLEFASIFARLGSQVTVLDRAETFAARLDRDVALSVREVLTAQGVTVVSGARVGGVADGPDGASTIRYSVKGEARALVADRILAATGRRANTDGLALDAAGVDTYARGNVTVNAHLQTSQPHIYAVGDVNGGPQFTYISLDDARIVADHLGGAANPRTLENRGLYPTTVFLTPPLAQVGITEEEARGRGLDVVIASKAVAEMAAMPRARIVGVPEGMMKFVIDARTDQVLGACLFSVDSTEVINLLTLAMRHGVTASELQQGIYTHPSATEGLNEVLGARRG
ncbi:FAD-dependent oxidoreductase [Micrococcales bacterium 31B]|nr:FAD-dependent oxidoreductase [Micrococcales bacterium 31B]